MAPSSISPFSPLTYSQFANIIFCMIKRQDIIVLGALLQKDSGKWTYAHIAEVSGISQSEAHSAVMRLKGASLLSDERLPVKSHVLEFLVHGLKYLFPIENLRYMAKGMPTAYAAPVAIDEFASNGTIPVWPTDDGTPYGRAIKPIYPTAPAAAARNHNLYAVLALFDMLRGGRLREKLFAAKRLEEMIA